MVSFSAKGSVFGNWPNLRRKTAELATASIRAFLISWIFLTFQVLDTINCALAFETCHAGIRKNILGGQKKM